MMNSNGMGRFCEGAMAHRRMSSLSRGMLSSDTLAAAARMNGRLMATCRYRWLHWWCLDCCGNELPYPICIRVACGLMHDENASASTECGAERESISAGEGFTAAEGQHHQTGDEQGGWLAELLCVHSGESGFISI